MVCWCVVFMLVSCWRKVRGCIECSFCKVSVCCYGGCFCWWLLGVVLWCFVVMGVV